MPFAPPSADALLVASLAGGAAVRIAAATIVALRGALPGVPPQAVVCLAAGLSLAAAPIVARSPAPAAVAGWGWLPILVAAEAACGAGLGVVAAAAIALGGQAGALVAGATGFGSDDDPASGDPGAVGLARLAWWIGAAAFVASGGARWLVAALLGSLESFPVGSLLAAAGGPVAGPVAAAATSLPGALVRLAAGLAVPALVAAIAFHLTLAIGFRAVRVAPAPGVVSGVVAVLVLVALVAHAPAWSSQVAAASAEFVAGSFELVPAGR